MPPSQRTGARAGFGCQTRPCALSERVGDVVRPLHGIVDVGLVLKCGWWVRPFWDWRSLIWATSKGAGFGLFSRGFMTREDRGPVRWVETLEDARTRDPREREVEEQGTGNVLREGAAVGARRSPRFVFST